MKHRFDVFVSYSHADSEWVRETLMPRLKGEGLEVCVDYEHFAPGGTIVDAITNAMKESRYTLLVFTESYLNSVWTQYERDFAMHSRITGGLSVIPLLLGKCTLPGTFPMLVPAELTEEADREYQMNKLVATLRNEIPAPLLPPPEPTPRSRYRNFDIELTPSDADRYQLRGGCAEIDAVTTQVVTVRFADLREGVQHVQRGTADRYICQEVGRKLYRAIFTPEVLDLWKKTAEVSNVDGRGVVRLRLRLHDRRLASLPWELLNQESAHRESFFMAMARTHPIVRYNGDVRMPPRDDAKHRANILVADTAVRKGSRTAPQIRANLERLLRTGKISGLKVHETASLPTLQSALRSGAYDVLHVIAQTEQRDGLGRLMLHDGRGVYQQVDAEMFAYFIRESPVRLLILSAADAAAPQVEAALAEVAAGANRAGVPAVVVVQGNVGHRATIAFANAFYDVLAEGCPIEAAMAEGRKAIVTAEGLDNPRWALPLLFNDEPDAMVFGPDRPTYCFGPRGGAIDTGTVDDERTEPGTGDGMAPKQNIGDDDFQQELIGRDAAVRQIRNAFKASGANVVLVTSPPGLGKTAAAREFARQAVRGAPAMPKYESVIWVKPSAADPGDVLRNSAHQVTADVLAFVILKTLGAVSTTIEESPLLKLEPAARLREIAALFSTGLHLIVIDDVSASAHDAVRAFIEAMPRTVHVVVTSVRRLGIGEQEVAVERLSDADTRTLTSGVAGGKAPSRQTFGGNPFVAIVETRRLMAGGDPLPVGVGEGDEVTTATYTRALLPILSVEERCVLAVCIELPYPADRFIVRAASGLDDARFEAAAQSLLRIGLIERRGDALVLCGTLRSLFRDGEEAALPDVKIACVIALMKYLDRAYERIGNPEATSFTLATKTELGNMVWGIRTAYGANQFEYLKGFRQFLHHSLYVLGFWNAALELGELSFLAASRVHDHTEMAWSALYPLARIHYRRGNLRDAERWCVTALGIFDAHDDPVGMVAARRYLGRLRQTEGEFEVARALFTHILDEVRRRSGHPDEVALSIENLAALELAAGSFGMAEKLYRDALTYRKPESQVSNVPTLHELGRLALARKDIETALEYFVSAREALADGTRENSFAKIAHSIGLAFEQQGELNAAQEQFKIAHQIFIRRGAPAEVAEVDAAIVRIGALQERQNQNET
jgi:tetratricopeptide (TPR) repeat protein